MSAFSRTTRTTNRRCWRIFRHYDDAAPISARSSLSDKEQLAEIMRHVIRMGSRIASARMQAVEEAEPEAAQEAEK